MNLLNKRPEVLTDEAEPADLIAALRGNGALDARQVAILDHVLRQWTLRQLQRSEDSDGLLELDELVFLATERLPSDLPDADRARLRWQAFRDLLESRRLAARHAGGDRARELHHAGTVLALLRDGARPQAEFSKELGVSAARVSQILSVMEEGGLIQRHRKGRENLVEAVGVPERPRPVRGMDLFSQAA